MPHDQKVCVYIYRWTQCKHYSFLKLLIITSSDQLDENSYNITNCLVLGEQWWSWNGICPSLSLLVYILVHVFFNSPRRTSKAAYEISTKFVLLSHRCTWELFVEHRCLLVLSKHNAINGFHLQGHMPFMASQCTKSWIEQNWIAVWVIMSRSSLFNVHRFNL